MHYQCTGRILIHQQHASAPFKSVEFRQLMFCSLLSQPGQASEAVNNNNLSVLQVAIVINEGFNVSDFVACD